MCLHNSYIYRINKEFSKSLLSTKLLIIISGFEFSKISFLTHISINEYKFFCDRIFHNLFFINRKVEKLRSQGV